MANSKITIIWTQPVSVGEFILFEIYRFSDGYIDIQNEQWVTTRTGIRQIPVPITPTEQEAALQYEEFFDLDYNPSQNRFYNITVFDNTVEIEFTSSDWKFQNFSTDTPGCSELIENIAAPTYDFVSETFEEDTSLQVLALKLN
jgi:hypothetical protein